MTNKRGIPILRTQKKIDILIDISFTLNYTLYLQVVFYFRAHVDLVDLLDHPVCLVEVECLDNLVPVVMLVARESVDLQGNLENQEALDYPEPMDDLDHEEIR